MKTTIKEFSIKAINNNNQTIKPISPYFFEPNAFTAVFTPKQGSKRLIRKSIKGLYYAIYNNSYNYL